MKRYILLLGMACAWLWAGAAGGADFYVSPQGNDNWDGRQRDAEPEHERGPFGSIERAQRAVQSLLNDEPERDEPIVVTVRGGRYRLSEPLKFGPEDSGREDAPVIYRAYEDEVPVLSGGQRMAFPEDDQPEDHDWWQSQLHDDQRIFSQLFVNDQRRFRPRLPASGYLRVERELEPSEAHADQGHDRFGFAEGDIPDELQIEGVEVMAIHIWAGSRMRIAELDRQQRELRFTGPTRTLAHWARFAKGHRYRLDNVRQAFGEREGEFYVDREQHMLKYVPREGEDGMAEVSPRGWSSCWSSRVTSSSSGGSSTCVLRGWSSRIRVGCWMNVASRFRRQRFI